MSTTRYPLGVFIGNPLAGNPSIQAGYAARFQAFSNLMGAAPALADSYVDYTKPVSEWLSSTTGSAWSMARTPGDANMVPVIALPMSSTAAGSPSADQTYKNFAAGDYDSMLQAMVKGWQGQGFVTQFWRPGWEMNLNSVTWNYAGANAATQADWIAAFQHISTVLHAAAQADGVNLKVVWNPGVTNYSNAGIATQTLYPGNKYVDVIAADVYGGLNPYSLYDWDKNNGTVDTSLKQWAADPVNLTHYYTYPAATQYSLDGSSGHSLSLANLLAFAKLQGKPVGVAETGAGSNADGGGVTDNPTFVNWLSSTLASSGDQVDFVNIWDINSVGAYEFSMPSDNKPLEAAAWANDFGAQGVTATVQSSVLHFGAPTDPATGSPEAGVTVTLLNSSGAALATSSSTSTGLVSFGALAAGTYQLRFAPPANQAIEPGSLANATTGLTAQFVVGVGQTVAAPVGSLISVSNLSGKVLLSGVGDFGVPVTLLNAAGASIATTTTNSGGSYAFAGLAAGSYQLRYTALHGQSLAPNSQANVTTGLTAMFTLAYGQPLIRPDEVFLPPASPATIQGRVTHFGAGTGQASGSGEAGVTVTLLDASGDVTGTTVSASDGSYSFGQLAPGTYDVGYTAPTGQAIEPGTAVDPTTGLTASFAVGAGQTVTAPTGSLVSFGSLSGQVLLTGVPEKGVAVSLLDAAGAVVASTTSNASGSVTFGTLLASTYQLKYTKPAGTVWQTGNPANPTTGLTAAITLGYGQVLSEPAAQLLTASTAANIQTSVQLYGGSTGTQWLGADKGVTVSLLNASGTVIATALSNSNGWLQFGSLGAGTYRLLFTPPAGQALEPATKTNPNPGLSAPITVGVGQAGSVAQEDLVAESSVSGRTLLANAGDPGVVVALLTAAGAVVATTTSNATGAFAFGGVAGGTYEVRFTAPQGQTLASGSEANSVTGLTPTFALKVGQSETLAAESLVTGLGTVKSKVLHFGSGTDPIGGSPEAGVTVTLENISGSVIATTTSGSDGSFAFTQVAAGTYKLLYAPPAGQVIEPGSLVDPTTGLTASFAVAVGQTVTAPAASMVAPDSVNGQVLLSAAADAGVAVALLNAAGTVVATTTTGTTGAFAFANVAAAAYQLRYTKPNGQAFETGGQADNAGLTPSFTIAYGQTLSLPSQVMLTTATASSIQTSVILYSASKAYLGNDGGVTVTLLNGSGATVASTVTTGNGYVQFGNIGAGTYQLHYTPPAGQSILAGSPINQRSGLGAQFTVGAGQTVKPAVAAMIQLAAPNAKALRALESLSVPAVATDKAEHVVHGSDGTVTIDAGGGGHLFDGGSGISFLNADGSAGNTFALNPGGASHLTTITGFSPAAGDVLDLKRTLIGTHILSDLSNVDSYISAAATGANTTLYIDPQGGGGTATKFAVLTGVHVTVAQLQTDNVFSLGV